MAKTYTAAGSATAGEVYTASAHNVIVTNVNNFIVPPIVVARRNATQSLANTTIVPISFDAEDVDTDGCFSATSTDITIQTAGVYLLVGSVAFANNASGGREVGFRKNGTTISNTTTGGGGGPLVAGANPNIGFDVAVNVSGITTLAASDVITMYGYQSSGGALNATARVQLAWIGRTS
jgi:hypothetical protein